MMKLQVENDRTVWQHVGPSSWSATGEVQSKQSSVSFLIKNCTILT